MSETLIVALIGVAAGLAPYVGARLIATMRTLTGQQTAEETAEDEREKRLWERVEEDNNRLREQIGDCAQRIAITEGYVDVLVKTLRDNGIQVPLRQQWGRGPR